MKKTNNNKIKKNIKEEIIEELTEEAFLKLKDLIRPEVLPSDVPNILTILPLRDVLVYPNMIFPILTGRSSSLAAVNKALDNDKFVFVSTQKDPDVDHIAINDIYEYGTVAKIIQVIKLPNNLAKVLVEGFFQAKIIKEVKNNDGCLEAKIGVIIPKYDKKDKKLEALIRRATDLFKEYIKIDRMLPPEIIYPFENISDPSHKLYYVAANIRTKLTIKQKLLSIKELDKQFFELNKLLVSEIELKKIEAEIDSKINETIQKNQKKFYIQEQIKLLNQELGEDYDEDVKPDIVRIKGLLEKANLPEYAKIKADEELNRLRQMNTYYPDYSTIVNYLEVLASLPWSNKTTDNLDIGVVKKILDEDHYNLEKPKERILEYIALLHFTDKIKKQILCFVGPPGVGKTSLAKSIARALGRNFVRFSLGGVRDEAEIRGHRKTYIGSMPGKILQSMKKAGSINPVMLLDEIDKMTYDFRGDPSSALLEVLDPEQNVAFNDHFLELDYDLSNVMFITTANVRDDIPLPLLDRMEIIEIQSYLENDKLNIANNYIIPKLIEEYKLDKLAIQFKQEAIIKIIRDYTREAGVRNLEREIASILRKIAKELVYFYYNQDKIKNKNKVIKNVINEKKVTELLKVPRYKYSKEKLEDKVGVVTGLAWTSAGGEILPIEVTIMASDSEKLLLTGKLGDVMKESATAALSFVRSNCEKFKLPKNFYTKKEIHIHVPEGAIPKDGPSAGVTICIALISAISGRKAKGNIAMTGEINLRGEVLAIGGLREKILAAKRIGINKVLIPKDNEKDLEEVSKDIKDGMTIVLIENVFEAHKHSF
ncbi:MAG: endopeptidase La [Bacteroidetes bacterium]|nr:endopeptidase La [Bacteroidota bacterium]